MAAVAISLDVVIFKLFSENKTILNLILANFTPRSSPLTRFTEKKTHLKNVQVQLLLAKMYYRIFTLSSAKENLSQRKRFGELSSLSNKITLKESNLLVHVGCVPVHSPLV